MPISEGVNHRGTESTERHGEKLSKSLLQYSVFDIPFSLYTFPYYLRSRIKIPMI
jgi:hypothetical protein